MGRPSGIAPSRGQRPTHNGIKLCRWKASSTCWLRARCDLRFSRRTRWTSPRRRWPEGPPYHHATPAPSALQARRADNLSWAVYRRWPSRRHRHRHLRGRQRQHFPRPHALPAVCHRRGATQRTRRAEPVVSAAAPSRRRADAPSWIAFSCHRATRRWERAGRHPQSMAPGVAPSSEHSDNQSLPPALCTSPGLGA